MTTLTDRKRLYSVLLTGMPPENGQRFVPGSRIIKLVTEFPPYLDSGFIPNQAYVRHQTVLGTCLAKVGIFGPTR